MLLSTGDTETTSVFSSHLHVYSQLALSSPSQCPRGCHRAGTPLQSLLLLLPLTVGRRVLAILPHQLQAWCPLITISYVPTFGSPHPLQPLEQLLGINIQITLSPDTTFWVNPKHTWEVGVRPAGSLHTFLKWLSLLGTCRTQLLYDGGPLGPCIYCSTLPEVASRLALGQLSCLFPCWVPPSDYDLPRGRESPQAH